MLISVLTLIFKILAIIKYPNVKKFLQSPGADFQSCELFDLLKIWEHFVVYTCIEVFQKTYDHLLFIRKHTEFFLGS